MIGSFFAPPARPADPVTPRVAPDRRIYAIGDVHGRHDALAALLEVIDQDARQFDDARKPVLVFLGDYIDRGPDSARVLDLLMRLSEGTDGRVQMLKGNHEAAMLRFLDDPEGGHAWLDFGGTQTLASFDIAVPRWRSAKALQRAAEDLTEKLGDTGRALRALPLFHISGGVVFVHAGLNPEDDTDEHAVLWGHEAFLCPDPLPGLLVVHGHYDAPQPVVCPGRICVDTGAYYTGCLTALRLDDDIGFVSAQA